MSDLCAIPAEDCSLVKYLTGRDSIARSLAGIISGLEVKTFSHQERARALNSLTSIQRERGLS